MRSVVFVATIVVVFLLGAFTEHMAAIPFGLLGTASARMGAAAPPAEAGNTAVPSYSRVRGLEDAPRSDTPQGARTDLQRCINTMILRREPEAEARTVCQKIIAGIGG